MMDLLWLLAVKLLLLFCPFHAVAFVGEVSINFVAYVTQPWRKVFWLCVNLYLLLCGGIFLLIMKLLFMPLWILTAIQREESLEAQLQELKIHHSEAEQRNTELEHILELTIENHMKANESLKEAEIKQKRQIDKFKLLQLRVLQLENENVALKTREERIPKAFQDGKRDSSQQRNICQDLPGTLHFPTFSVRNMERPFLVNKEAMHQGRGIALSSSMFSVFLSLLVGIITWEAQDFCIPLVLALLMVVCVSLKTVVQFFLSIDGRPGFEAVALLSFSFVQQCPNYIFCCYKIGTLVLGISRNSSYGRRAEEHSLVNSLRRDILGPHSIF